jgi:hypothetical protein
LVEFIELFAIMANIGVFGGLDLRQVAFVFALANAGWALAEVVFRCGTRFAFWPRSIGCRLWMPPAGPTSWWIAWA